MAFLFDQFKVQLLFSISIKNKLKSAQWAQNVDFWKFHDVLQKAIKLIFYMHGLKDVAAWMLRPQKVDFEQQW